MKHWIQSSVLTCLASALVSPLADAQQGGRACERSNRALLVSSQHQAKANYWQRTAECLADPQGIALCKLKDAQRAWRAEDTLALQVFQARESACALFGHVLHDPPVVAAHFGRQITNRYAPVAEGITLVREKRTADGLERIETSMNEAVHVVAGVPCRTVRERETLDGLLVEDTHNWIAQNQDGAVWYFGELAMGFEDGLLDRLDGSWRYGKDGAKPGVLAPISPLPGDVFRQEFLLGRAEDIGQVMATDETVVVPAGVFEHCLVILEWDPLEPFEYLLSFIAPNVGVVLELDQSTGERSELVQILP